jgi:hypothetical protein
MMRSHTKMRPIWIIRVITQAAVLAVISTAMLAPAEAQFWPFGGSSPQRPPQQRQQQYNPFGGWFGGGGIFDSRPQRPRAPAADYSQPPPPARRTAETPVTSPILVLGDGMAEWLAYGLEDAFAERPEFGIVRKHRAFSGLVRYDPKRDVEWPQVARELIAAERPKFIVMMVGFHDRQPIRERGATPARTSPTPSPTDDPEYHDPETPESRARQSADEQNAELQRAERSPETAPAGPTRGAPAGPMEFQSEAWQAAYIQRIDATIAALKSANVPVFWVGLPPQRNPRQAADAVYLNELYRARAERAGIVFIDIWDGFVDEAGRYIVQGADFEGQIRRLRSGDGIFFTRAGARKLAHYIEREIMRLLLNRDTPVALPVPDPAANLPQQGKGAARPIAGPVIPLTATVGGGNELLGGGGARPVASDSLATRVLIKGEPVTAPPGRADNFAWPRGAATTIREDDGTPAASAPQPGTVRPSRGGTAPAATETPAAPVAAPARTPAASPSASTSPAVTPPRAKSIQPPADGEAKPPVQRRIPPRANNDLAPRPPAAIPR